MIINQVYINISLLRTLVRNSYMHHLNEVTNFIPNIKYNSHTLILLNIQIFYTIENEYSPDPLPGESSQKMRERVSDALSDKLYVSPALDTASWCNETGYSVYLYVHKVLVLQYDFRQYTTEICKRKHSQQVFRVRNGF